MYWKAWTAWETHSGHLIGIALFLGPNDKKPVVYIFKTLDSTALKKKWIVPRKIKKWVLFNYFCATHFPKAKLLYLQEEPEVLSQSEISIITNKFPFQK